MRKSLLIATSACLVSLVSAEEATSRFYLRGNTSKEISLSKKKTKKKRKGKKKKNGSGNNEEASKHPVDDNKSNKDEARIQPHNQDEPDGCQPNCDGSEPLPPADYLREAGGWFDVDVKELAAADE